MKSGSYSTSEASRISGLSYRQIDYWCRTGLVRPSLQDATGSGAPYRRWSGADVDMLVLIAKLLKAGVSLQQIRRDGNPRRTAERVVASLAALIEQVPA